METLILISDNGSGFLDDLLKTKKIDRKQEKVFFVSIQTQRSGRDVSNTVTVFIYYPGKGAAEPRVVGVEREE